MGYLDEIYSEIFYIKLITVADLFYKKIDHKKNVVSVEDDILSLVII